MSQIYKSLASGPIPPTIVEEFVIDDGGPVFPDTNIIILKGRDSTETNDNGIRTINDPNPPLSDPSNAIFVELTNRITGSLTTSNATGQPLIEFDLADTGLGAIPGVFYFWGDVTAFNVTDSAGASWGVSGSIITDGATATEIGTEVSDSFLQAAMATALIAFGASGNDFVMSIQGIEGKTINWSGMFNYRFVS